MTIMEETQKTLGAILQERMTIEEELSAVTAVLDCLPDVPSPAAAAAQEASKERADLLARREDLEEKLHKNRLEFIKTEVIGHKLEASHHEALIEAMQKAIDEHTKEVEEAVAKIPSLGVLPQRRAELLEKITKTGEGNKDLAEIEKQIAGISAEIETASKEAIRIGKFNNLVIAGCHRKIDLSRVRIEELLSESIPAGLVAYTKERAGRAFGRLQARASKGIVLEVSPSGDSEI